MELNLKRQLCTNRINLKNSNIFNVITIRKKAYPARKILIGPSKVGRDRFIS